MLNQSNQNDSPFAFKIRVRVCGVLKENDRILLLKHMGIGPANFLWSPPGGGVEFGESLEKTLVKEFLEETNLNISVDQYLFANEHIDSKHHAVEHFYKVSRVSGELKVGFDPELDSSNQIIKEAKFFDKSELDALEKATIHSSFLVAKSRDKIDDLRGLITFKA